MKRLIVGAVFSALSVLGMSQQRYDATYQRIIDRDESKILVFLSSDSATNYEKLICYDYDNQMITDVSKYNFRFTVGTDYDKVDSLSSISKNLVLAHPHNLDADAYREMYSDNKRAFRKIQKVPDKVIEKRALKEIPSIDDIVEYYTLKEKNSIENHYIEVSGNLYSFSTNNDVSFDSAITAYTKVIKTIKENHCKLYDLPGRCKEPDMAEISRFINDSTPVKILDHNALFPKVDVQFDRVDSVINNYFSNKISELTVSSEISELAVAYDIDNNKLTNIISISYGDSAEINLQKSDSIFQQSDNVVIGHIHPKKNQPMVFYPSPTDILQEIVFHTLYPGKNISFRIYPVASEVMSVEYFMPKDFAQRISKDKEKNKLYLKSVIFGHLLCLQSQRNLFEIMNKSLIKYNLLQIPILVHGQKSIIE